MRRHPLTREIILKNKKIPLFLHSGKVKYAYDKHICKFWCAIGVQSLAENCTPVCNLNDFILTQLNSARRFIGLANVLFKPFLAMISKKIKAG